MTRGGTGATVGVDAASERSTPLPRKRPGTERIVRAPGSRPTRSSATPPSVAPPWAGPSARGPESATLKQQELPRGTAQAAASPRNARRRSTGISPAPRRRDGPPKALPEIDGALGSACGHRRPGNGASAPIPRPTPAPVPSRSPGGPPAMETGAETTRTASIAAGLGGRAARSGILRSASPRGWPSQNFRPGGGLPPRPLTFQRRGPSKHDQFRRRDIRLVPHDRRQGVPTSWPRLVAQHREAPA